jgi:hypothetical protein
MIWQEQWNRNKGGMINKVRRNGKNRGKRKFKKGSEEEIS